MGKGPKKYKLAVKKMSHGGVKFIRWNIIHNNELTLCGNI